MIWESAGGTKNCTSLPLTETFIPIKINRPTIKKQMTKQHDNPQLTFTGVSNPVSAGSSGGIDFIGTGPSMANYEGNQLTNDNIVSMNNRNGKKCILCCFTSGTGSSRKATTVMVSPSRHNLMGVPRL